MRLQKFLYLTIIIAAMFCLTGFSIAQRALTPYEGNPIISYGSSGSWDAGWVAFGKTIFHDGLYYIFYEGSPDVNTNPISIGYATSSDGISFTKYEQNPILEGDSTGFDAFFVAEPVPLFEGNQWILYYNASSNPRPGPGNAIGRATATNPSGPWTRDTSAVLKVGNPGEWDSRLITPNTVIHTDSNYIMYYSASSGTSNEGKPAMVGMATSQDGITWTKYDDPATTNPPYAESDPVLPLGIPGNWDAAFAWECSVWQTDSGWKMYYSGTPSDFSTEQIGYATSTDGIHWTKYANNPLFGPTEQWTGLWVVAGSLLQIDSSYFLYYTGFSGFTSAQIGLATTSITGINEDFGNFVVPSNFSLSQNYPNPFNPSTTIEFTLPKPGWVSLKVYDLLGRKVATLISKELKKGNYKYNWDASNLASGVYFYRIERDGINRTKKLLLLK